MKKYLLCLCLVVVVSLAASAADSPDAKAIQGDWSLVQGELAGQPLPDAMVKTISLNLTDGRYAVLAGGKPDNGTYALDATTNPRSITVTGTDGPNKGKTFPAIYELNGDTLRICYDLSGARRPAEFKTVAGPKLYLATYTRKR